MSDIIAVVASVASLAVSLVGLLFTVAAYRKIDTDTAEAFAVMGADEGNHEARLERLENKAGLPVIPSPSALEIELQDVNGSVDFAAAFDDEHENTELQLSDEPKEEIIRGN